MQINKNALNGLLSLNDKQLMSIINRLAADSGIDPAQFNIDPKDVASVRTALSSATEDDLQSIVKQYEANKKARGGIK